MTYRTKNQENHNLSERRQPTDGNIHGNKSELELSDQNFRAVIIKMIQQSIINSLVINGKNRKFQQGNKIIFKMEMIELEDTTAPMNHSLDGLKRRDDTG